jgi:pyrrolidone-carboxylate peptidase
MRLAEARGHRFRAGFLHVPALHERPGAPAPAVPLESIVQGITAVLEATAQER